ncbi:P-loop containing nucleoside triphosphate hydrolase protein [Chytriomyces cf. hyalinus JEL632]|nr:P-loop containing nucleoside triphosphate hydrolase protein [Chytriomyces cf. hyalinus JEL632]
MDGAEPTSRQLQPKKVAKPKSAKSAEPKKAAPRVKLTASKAGVSKSDGWGKAEDRSVRDHTGAIGSSNFRSLNLQKSKFGKGGARNAGFKGKGRFGGSSYGTKLKSYSYKSSGGFSNENPWTACIDDAVEAIHSDVERKRLLALPDFDFERFGDAHEIDEEIAAVSPSYFDEDALSQFPTQRFVDLNSALKSLTGLESFREGQVKTIKRILNGESTILVLPTGGGKSLCYQLPAYVLRILSKNKQSCLCLVISPMVSLMQDQMRCLPPKLKGACLSSNQSASEYKATMDALNSDEIDILYVTPEKLQTESFQTFVHQQRLSKIRFVCIDEAHCLTEWSHNFRTSYLSLNTVVEEVLGRPCVLGLTATATLQARKACVDMLGLEAGMGAVVAESRMRENLKLSVSKVNSTDNRDMLLENLLKSDAFAGLNSIIVYTMFQNQADNVAKYLRTRNFDADSYHAGKPHLERAILQQKFMSNRLRILVATVAFGLGINKPDVRSVIHYNLPKSLENYMQECGRSGRDGLPALCHVFLSTEDYVRHRSFAYSEGVDEASVWKFVLRVFGEKKKATANSKSTKEGSRVGTIQGRRTMIIPIEETESELDMKESVLATLLTYMEGFEDKPIRVFPAIYGSFSVHFNKQSAFDLADTNPVLAAILKNSQKTKGKLVVDALSVCSDADVSPSVLNMTLMDLKRKKEIHFEGLERAFHIELVNAVMTQKDDEYLDRMRLLLTSKMRNLETSRVAKLDVLYEALLNASVDSIDDIIWDADVPMDEADLSPDAIQLLEEAQRRMSTLKNTVHEYFETETGTLETFESQSSENEVGSEDACLLGVKEGFRDPNLAERSNKCKKILRIDLTDFIVQNSAVFTSGNALIQTLSFIDFRCSSKQAAPSPEFSTVSPAPNFQHTIGRRLMFLLKRSSPLLTCYYICWKRYKNKAWNSYSHFSFGELVKMASKALMEFRMRSSKSEQNMDE